MKNSGHDSSLCPYPLASTFLKILSILSTLWFHYSSFELLLQAIPELKLYFLSILRYCANTITRVVGKGRSNIEALDPDDSPSAMAEPEGNAGAREEDKKEDRKEVKERKGTHEAGDVQGNLKIHIKLDLDVDIRIIAKIKGDIAIGIL
ncbi:hypothetical protein GJ744_001606 [Endocarpon pusillum]|uniref:Uncharacterized protein n=1 Tax=Endocarpon pusillum TaxID=364733 RepID=A0A8H7A943_9EURO|nr:hypothetical protein GJ744_001606 [Endocarpon pusillum]